MTREEAERYIALEGPSVLAHYPGSYYRGWCAGIRDAAERFEQTQKEMAA